MKNFPLIKQYIENRGFPDDDHFYFIQVIKRKKEHPNSTKSNEVILTYYINSTEHLDEKRHEIITLCDTFDARAYIHLNLRSYRKCAFHMLKNISDHIVSNNYEYIKKSYNTVCGQYPDDEDKTWVVDLDCFNSDALYYMEDAINECDPVGNKIRLLVPTKNGIHIISEPFNLYEFQKEYATFLKYQVDIHKNNPTLLYWK